MYKIVEIIRKGDNLFLPFFKGDFKTIPLASPISEDGYNLIKFDGIKYGSFELAKDNINKHKMIVNKIQYIIHDI